MICVKCANVIYMHEEVEYNNTVRDKRKIKMIHEFILSLYSVLDLVVMTR